MEGGREAESSEVGQAGEAARGGREQKKETRREQNKETRRKQAK